MTYPDAPVVCVVCREHTDLKGLVAAGMIRDDELPPRCALCGFVIDTAGQRAPETQKAPSA